MTGPAETMRPFAFEIPRVQWVATVFTNRVTCLIAAAGLPLCLWMISPYLVTGQTMRLIVTGGASVIGLVLAVLNWRQLPARSIMIDDGEIVLNHGRRETRLPADDIVCVLGEVLRVSSPKAPTIEIHSCRGHHWRLQFFAETIDECMSALAEHCRFALIIWAVGVIEQATDAALSGVGRSSALRKSFQDAVAATAVMVIMLGLAITMLIHAYQSLTPPQTIPTVQLVSFASTAVVGASIGGHAWWIHLRMRWLLDASRIRTQVDEAADE